LNPASKEPQARKPSASVVLTPARKHVMIQVFLEETGMTEEIGLMSVTISAKNGCPQKRSQKGAVNLRYITMSRKSN